MKVVTMYEANDGKQFSTEASCLEYEQALDDTFAANEMLENGATLMSVLTRANQTRPWWGGELTLEDKVILMKTTKDTGFVVRHWQCHEKPTYKVCAIETGGRLYLSGETRGATASYGNWVSPKDLLLYARQTPEFAT